VKKRIEATKTKHERTTLDGDAQIAIPSKNGTGPGTSKVNNTGSHNVPYSLSSKS
jgi:hypothetical protein